MEAKVRKKGDYLVVSVSGRLELEPVEVFRQHCFTHLKTEKFVFNVTDLSFVGSTGIKSFLDILSGLVRMQESPLKVVGASSEYTRIFSSHLEAMVEFYEDDEVAIRSFTMPVQPPQPEVVQQPVQMHARQEVVQQPVQMQAQPAPGGEITMTAVPAQNRAMTPSPAEPVPVTAEVKEENIESLKPVVFDPTLEPGMLPASLDKPQVEQYFNKQVPRDFD